MFYNPIRIIDPDGRDGWDVVSGIIDAVIDDISISSRTISSSSTANNESHYNAGQVIGHVLAAVIDGGGKT